MKSIKEFFERISPIKIEPSEKSLTLELSERFVLFELMKDFVERIEEDPYLNFISVLKYYKVLGNFLHGPIKEIHRDRKKPYFIDFFTDKELYTAVLSDIEWAYSINKNANITITKRGAITYSNYSKDKFNILLLTIHSGTWMPKFVEKKQVIEKSARLKEEDLDSHRLYARLVLERSGIWVDNKLSRFSIDMNREEEKAIYTDKSEAWVDKVWASHLAKSEKEWLLESYKEFHFMLSKLVDTYRFNIILDGHTMRDHPGRPDISFGTIHVPKFYLPIVIDMKSKLDALGYYSVELNAPYGGGHIVKFLRSKFPNIFLCSMEINKKLFMKDNLISEEEKLKKVSGEIMSLFDF